MRFQIGFFLLLCQLHASVEITDSVIPLMKEVNCLDHVNPRKFSKNQYNDIAKKLLGAEDPIRLVTYNMLYNIKDSDLDECDRWPSRYPRILQLIEWINPDILCSQELHRDQLDDLLAFLKDKFTFIGEPNKEDGEIEGIFFRTDRFDLLNSESWLLFPDLPSSYPHILTKVVLQEKNRHVKFAIFNTHLPFFSADQREISAQFIQQQVEITSHAMPVFLAGDFNTFPQQRCLTSLPYYDGDYLQKILTKGVLKNCTELALLGHVGPISTFTTDDKENNTGVAFRGKGIPGVILDHIYADPSSMILIHAIEPAKVSGHFPSDHMPVIVDFVLPS